MYVYAPSGLGYALAQPAPKPQPASTLLSTYLQEFLRQIKNQREDNTLILATATLHPRPWDSRFWLNRTFPVGKRTAHLTDEIFLSTSGTSTDIDVAQALVEALQQISTDFQKRNEGFRKQIEAAVTLRGDIMNALSIMGRDPQKLQPYLTTIMLPNRTELELQRLERIGYAFAKAKFPKQLNHRILHTLTFEVNHLTIGRWLERYAELFLKKDAAFRRQVEEKLKMLHETKDPSYRRKVEEKLKLLKQ